MPLGDYIVGAVDFLAVVGAIGAATWLLVRKRLTGLEGAPRLLAFVIVFTVGLIAAHVLPGALGLLTRVAVAVTALLLLAAAIAVPPAASQPTRAPEPREVDSLLSRALALAGLAALGIALLAYARQTFTSPNDHIDNLVAHFPVIASWVQSGDIWPVTQLDPDLAQGNYPQNGAVVFLAAVLPWENDAFLRGAAYLMLAPVPVAVYALGREVAAPRTTAILLAALVTALPLVAITAVNAMLADSLLLWGFTAGLVFLVRHARTSSGRDLVLAGLGLGLAFGSKWYGVPAVATVLAIWALATLRSRWHEFGRAAALGATVRQGAALVGLVLLAGGFWLLRNLVATGNPVFPAKVAPFGLTLFDAPPDTFRERLGFTIADYLDQPRVLKDVIAPDLWDAFGLAGALLLLGLMGAVLMLVATRRSATSRRSAGIAAVGLAASLVLAAVYTVTPDTALGPPGQPVLVFPNARYLLPAVICAVGVTAWFAGSHERTRLVLEPLALLAVLDGLRRSFDLRTSDIAIGAAALVVLVATGYAAWAAAGWARARGTRGRVVALGAGVCALIVVLGAGHAYQDRFNNHRYTGADAALDWIYTNAPEDRRIGVTGLWPLEGYAPVYPAFGPRLRNEVEYIGPTVRDYLRRYRDPESFQAALARGGYDLVLVGRGRPPDGVTREERWAREAGFVPVAQSRGLTLLTPP